MRFAIIGFQTSGKTTVFNALTGQHAETSAFSTGQANTNQAIVHVPDTRLDKLTELYKPKKHTPATVEYVDLAGMARQEGSGGDGLGDKQLNEIATADALLAVVRNFTNAAGDAPDPIGDIEAMALEMTLSDMAKVDTRLERIEKQFDRTQGKARDALFIEQAALQVIRPLLEEGRPARLAELDADQTKSLRGFQMLTLKPTLWLLNDGEDEWAAGRDQAVQLPGELASVPRTAAARLCGQMEMEIAQLDAEERTEFLADYGIERPAAERVIEVCYELLGCISFLTVGPDECRAWTIRSGETAPEAAGTIHSDLQRGFIRAEVCNWADLLDAGSTAELKKRAKLRLEGKAYVVQDGDVMNILFSV